MKYILLTCEEAFWCIDSPKEETNPSGWFHLLIGEEQKTIAVFNIWVLIWSYCYLRLLSKLIGVWESLQSEKSEVRASVSWNFSIKYWIVINYYDLKGSQLGSSFEVVHDGYLSLIWGIKHAFFFTQYVPWISPWWTGGMCSQGFDCWDIPYFREKCSSLSVAK